MIRIAKNHSDFVFWTYTKNYNLVNEYCKEYSKESIPANFHIMFSEWDGLTLNNPFNFPIFTCKMKDGNKNHPDKSYFDNMFKCPGNCDICKEYKLGCIAGINTYADEH